MIKDILISLHNVFSLPELLMFKCCNITLIFLVILNLSLDNLEINKLLFDFFVDFYSLHFGKVELYFIIKLKYGKTIQKPLQSVPYLTSHIIK